MPRPSWSGPSPARSPIGWTSGSSSTQTCSAPPASASWSTSWHAPSAKEPLSWPPALLVARRRLTCSHPRFPCGKLAGRSSESGVEMANFGMVGVDWQQRVDWARLRKYRLERARERMKAHGLGALLLMYDENCRYVTSTLTPGWNRLKPGLRYALLCGDGAPVLFEQGDIGLHIEKHSPWIPKENIRYSYAWIKGAAGPASTMQVTKFTNAIKQEMKKRGVDGMKLGVDFI